MASAKHYRQQVGQILNVMPKKRGRTRISFEWDNLPEAKLRLTEVRQIQKRLRLVKKDINAEMKAIRARYNQEAHSVKSDMGDRLLFGKGKAKSRAAAKKRKIRASRERALQPYEDVKRFIDEALIELDLAKAQLSTWIEQNR